MDLGNGQHLRYPGTMIDSYRVIGPLLRLIDAEIAHDLAVRALRLGLATGTPVVTDPALRVRVWDLRFANPLGLAAGFDKNGAVIDALLSLGFGFVEAGTVTPRPQVGNPKPRLFRLPEEGAVINRMGFNNDGAARVVARLVERRALENERVTARHRADGLVGVNIGPNKDENDPPAACAGLVETFSSLADYLVVNVSSPNTPGLRALQHHEPLREVLAACRAARDRGPCRPPLLVKIAPDLDDGALAQIACVVADGGADGIIVSNTTIGRPVGIRGRHRAEAGGLSGRPLFAPSTAVLSRVYTHVAGAVPLIGVGGVASGGDAYAKIRAGATLVQLYTALVYQGPGVVGRILRDLAACLRRDGFSSIEEVVGADHRQAKGMPVRSGTAR